ncbi:hypothetical protein [Planktotalea sp.]|uniref:hypothetical protein n=1 Tax=Planktotalea sp. TaxID=2029877 RepID=UPI003298A4CF
MSSHVLNSTAYLIEDHKYVYDIQALNHNIKRCRSLAQKHGFSMRVVLKGGYLHANIVGELSQIADLRFALGKDDKAVLDVLRGRDVSTLYPRQRMQARKGNAFNRIVVTDVSALNTVNVDRIPEIIIPVATSENREGLLCEDIADVLIEIEHRHGDRVQIGGFQMNFGCLIHEPPCPAEIQRMLDRLSVKAITSRLGMSPVMSIGGSAVLPILEQIEVPKPFDAELRVGEAILTGSIPGSQQNFGLKPTSYASASILQELRPEHEGIRRVLLDVGHTVFDVQAIERDYDGLAFQSLSSDVSVATLPSSPCITGVAPILLPLNYGETERALARNSNEIAFLASG